jgi:outer membrane protein TolC
MTLLLCGRRDRLKVARDHRGRAQHPLRGIMQAQRHGLVLTLAVVQQQAVLVRLRTVIPPLQQSLATTGSALALSVGKARLKHPQALVSPT